MTSQIQKIIFLSSKNPFTHNDWSGIPYHLFRNLTAHYSVTYVSLPAFTFIRRIGVLISRIFFVITGKRYLFDYGVFLSLLYGMAGSIKLIGKKDFLFVFSPAGLTETAFIKTKLPIVSYGDCSTLQMINYYPALTVVSKLSKTEVGIVEKKALRKASLVFFTSSWAKSFVFDRYGIQSRVIPFGANLTPRSTYSPRKLQAGCTLLFIGFDWYRKGGDFAVEIHRRLLNEKIASKLVVVGASLPSDIQVEGITNVCHLSKDSEEEKAQMHVLFSQADFLILPTRADCTPIVIAEAFAYGLPVLASRTGGIPSMIEYGETGFLFEKSDIHGYATVIRALLDNPDEYHRLSMNCIEQFEKTYNWTQWIVSLNHYVKAPSFT